MEGRCYTSTCCCQLRAARGTRIGCFWLAEGPNQHTLRTQCFFRWTFSLLNPGEQSTNLPSLPSNLNKILLWWWECSNILLCKQLRNRIELSWVEIQHLVCFFLPLKTTQCSDQKVQRQKPTSICNQHTSSIWRIRSKNDNKQKSNCYRVSS